jgi:hypothetical protein
MNKKWRYVLICLVVLWVCNKLFLIYVHKTYTKEDIEAFFEPITSKYGIKIVYEIGNDFFSALENPPIPAGPPRYSKVEPIRHRVLLRYPALLQKAFDKYPIEVIRKYLNAIYFVNDIDANGLKFGGTYDPFRKIIYLVDNGGKNDDQAIRTFHHEFSSMLLKSHSFWVDPWTNHHPKDFKYLLEIYKSWKALEQEVDISKEGTEQDYEKGFMRIYGQTNFEDDFNEYSAMIFTYPDKFKKIMYQYPRVRGKFKIWLEFYQKIDPIFTEKYLFGLK